MKIGLIADSHDHRENIEKAISVFKAQKVRLVIHLGDYVSPGSVKLFKGLKLVGIFGNNDGDRLRLVKAFAFIGGEIKGDFCQLELGGLKFAIYHGTEASITDALINCRKYDVVAFGHTHECVNKKVGKTLVLNPGSAHGFDDKATILIFDTQKKPEFVVL